MGRGDEDLSVLDTGALGAVESSMAKVRSAAFR
jgi:hypothetical protein